MTIQDPQARSLPDLLSALVSDLSDLMRKESQLVRTEVAENLAQAKKAGAGLAIGAALLLGAFLILLQALVLALAKVMDPLLASLLAGVAVGAIGLFVVLASAKGMQPSSLAPDRSARQLRKDMNLVKGQMQ